MRKLIYLVGMTLDGRIAGPKDEIDFFPLADDVLEYLRTELADTLPTHVRAVLGIDAPISRFDTVIMGRRTYQPAIDAGVTSPYRHLRQYVVSSSAESIDDPEVTPVQEDPLDFVRRLKRTDGRDLWLAGGGQLAGSLEPEIDEYVIKHYPVIAGAGVPMLTGVFAPRALQVVSTREFSDGTRIVSYRPASSPG
jgi:dihydrofolate reductase